MLRSAIDDVIDQLVSAGYDLPASLKRRDRREPGRLEKEQMEDRLYMLFKRRFKKQLTALRERLEHNYPSKKDNSIPPIPIDDIINGEEDSEFVADLIRVISSSAVGGVSLFKQSVNIGMDYTMINDRALEWAQTYSYNLIGKATGGIDATTRNMVSNVISRFVDTPGFTIGDAINQLSETFGETRARMIAVTEITRAYAQGNQIAGEELKKEFPDVKVTKTWFTDGDACEICRSLEGKEVEIEEEFDAGIYDPPAHVNCGCWTQTRTRI